MNEYKITYTVTGSAGTFTQNITDRSEASAKKFFRETSKELGRTLQSVELLRTDAPASKRNERETLKAIRQLVTDLGPQSYLATAFEGCFEIAEQNIEYDFGDSLKGRLESAERKVKELEGELRKAQQGIDELIQKDDERKAALERMSAKSLSEDDLGDIRQLLDDRATEADERAERAAAEIVKYAEDPTSEEFREAVKMHRNYAQDAEYIRGLLGRVVAAQAVSHAQTGKEGQAA